MANDTQHLERELGREFCRLYPVEAALVGASLDAEAIAAAAAAAAGECEPFSDSIASEWYRRQMAGVRPLPAPIAGGQEGQSGRHHDAK